MSAVFGRPEPQTAARRTPPCPPRRRGFSSSCALLLERSRDYTGIDRGHSIGCVINSPLMRHLLRRRAATDPIAASESSVLASGATAATPRSVQPSAHRRGGAAPRLQLPDRQDLPARSHGVHRRGWSIQDGVLYEGTGLNGQSWIRKVRLENGEVLQQAAARAAVLRRRDRRLEEVADPAHLADRSRLRLRPGDASAAGGRSTTPAKAGA